MAESTNGTGGMPDLRERLAVAEQMNSMAASAGLEVELVSISRYGTPVKLQVSNDDHSPSGAERAASALLTMWPRWDLQEMRGLLYLSATVGDTAAQFYFGSGSADNVRALRAVVVSA